MRFPLTDRLVGRNECSPPLKLFGHGGSAVCDGNMKTNGYIYVDKQIDANARVWMQQVDKTIKLMQMNTDLMGAPDVFVGGLETNALMYHIYPWTLPNYICRRATGRVENAAAVELMAVSTVDSTGSPFQRSNKPCNA